MFSLLFGVERCGRVRTVVLSTAVRPPRVDILYILSSTMFITKREKTSALSYMIHYFGSGGAARGCERVGADGFIRRRVALGLIERARIAIDTDEGERREERGKRDARGQVRRDVE